MLPAAPWIEADKSIESKQKQLSCGLESQNNESKEA